VLLSIRDSARLLAPAGLTVEQTRLLLRTGLTGPAMPVGSSLGYDAEAVGRLARWPEVEADAATVAVTEVLPAGLYVARLGRGVSVDLSRPWATAAESLRDQPAMTELSRALLAARIAGHGRLPWVATLFGFVVLGAEAVGVGTDLRSGRTVFALEPPGAWWTGLEGCRLRTRRGRPGLLLTASTR